MRKYRSIAIAVAVMVGLASAAAHGQSTGGVVGIVADESGAPLPGVVVQVSSPALIGGARTAVTTADGRFQVVDLRPGEYVVTFELAGFQTVRRENIPLSMPEVTKQLEAQGAQVASLAYGAAPDFATTLARTDIYVWLPAGDAAQTPAEQRALLTKWLDDKRGRQIHFHWNGGTRDVDGLPVPHTAPYDAVYVDALDIDYKALSRQQDAAIALLRSGEVHITTPEGTDWRFSVGDRPFNKQDGDASKARMASARVRVDREIELPAGVLRVAPIESTANGVLVVPKARFGDAIVTGARLRFERGIVTEASAQSGEPALQAFLKSVPGASRFREFGLGFNSRLVVPAKSTALPYYG